MPQLVSWHLGAGGDPGVPGGRGLCATVQGWQPCPRPLTQHRHRQRRAGNSRCRQCAGSCQAWLPDPCRLRDQTAAVPCLVWGQARQIPSRALAGAVAPLLGERARCGAGSGRSAVPRASGDYLSTLLGTSCCWRHGTAGVPSQLPPSSAQCHAFPALALLAGLRPQGLAAVPAPSHIRCAGGGGRLTHWPRAPGTHTHKRRVVAPHSSRALQTGCPDARWLAQSQECLAPSLSMLSSPLHPMACREPVGGQPRSPICLDPPASWHHTGTAALQGHSSRCPPAPCPPCCSRRGDGDGDVFGKPARRERH